MILLQGSSALAPFYSLQGVFNTFQIFALILSTIGMLGDEHSFFAHAYPLILVVPVSGRNLEDKWKKLFLGTM